MSSRRADPPLWWCEPVSERGQADVTHTPHAVPMCHRRGRKPPPAVLVSFNKHRALLSSGWSPEKDAMVACSGQESPLLCTLGLPLIKEVSKPQVSARPKEECTNPESGWWCGGVGLFACLCFSLRSCK